MNPSPGAGYTPTHVTGLDFVLNGGLPPGRATLLVGGPGSGKTILAAEFIAGGARNGEPGLLVSFDTTVDRLLSDLDTLDLGIGKYVDEGVVAAHHVNWEAVKLPDSGAFTLDGLILQFESLLDDLGGARRLALDSIESLLATAEQDGAVRRELRKLFDWLADRNITAVITAERAANQLTSLGVEEYLADCVILLEFDLEERVATRRLRVLKRRGGGHSSNEHPFLISQRGIHLFPLTASVLAHDAPAERVSTGIDGLDTVLAGEGYFRGASILISGTPGAGKSSMAAAFVDAACRRGEKAFYYAFEESPSQIVRNMGSVGYGLGQWLDSGALQIHAQRPSEQGLEQHLLRMHQAVEAFEPDVVVLDPFTSLTGVGFEGTTREMMIRLVDLLKSKGITALYTSLGAVRPDDPGPVREQLISSLMDTWIVLESRRLEGERTRFLWVIKSRGMAHSRSLHELKISGSGIELGPARESVRPAEPPS